ncbi:MAG: polysaccharide pyruvyl transferase family protein [Clostridium sp.]|nr:polysaccharide pyruvyl transferase family protein [Clostridium sp.]MDU7084667.1 polysaccharide pyruvyl transferase family protein [Clostridium sp.]
MKLQIKHINNTFNYGSLMMATVIISALDKKNKNIKFYVDCSSDKDLERLKRETGINAIYRDNIGPGNNLIERFSNKVKRVFLNRRINNIEQVIILGGDDISEYYGIKILETFLKEIEEQSKSKNLILLGQTIGPFTEERGDMAKRCLKNTKIYCREDKCLSYLKSLNFKNVKNGMDLAFAELPMQSHSNDILNKYKLKKDEYICIVASGLSTCYTNNITDYIEEYINILNVIIHNERLTDKKIVLLPHVLLPRNVDDRLVINEMVNNLNPDLKNGIISINDELLPSEARAILGGGIFTITGRMHAAVSTFFMGKPAISLSYSVKYAGVIGEGLDMNELIIEAAVDKLWKDRMISEIINKKICYVLDNYDQLAEKINKNIGQTTEIIKNELDDLANEIIKI